MRCPRLPWCVAALAHVAVVAVCAYGEMRTVLDSGAAGPTLLLVDATDEGETTFPSALRQVGRWRLTAGKIISVTEREASVAVRSVTPDAALVVDTERHDVGERASATLAARGVAADALQETLSTLVDPGHEPVRLATAPRVLPTMATGTPVVELVLPAGKRGLTLGERVRLVRHAVHDIAAERKMTDESP